MTSARSSRRPGTPPRPLPRLARLLNDRLEATGWTRAELANRLDIAPISISKWLNGRDPLPWRHYLIVADVLNIPLPELLRAAKADHPHHVALFEKFIGRTLRKQSRAR